MADYIGCTVCGMRFVGNAMNCGCEGCGSSLIQLEKNLSPEVEKILREHGQRSSEKDQEFEIRKKK